MFRVPLTLVLLISCINLFGQKRIKGDAFIGATGMGSISKLMSTTYTQLGLNASVAWFIDDNFGAGFQINSVYQHYKYFNGFQRQLEIGFSPFVRWYIPIKKSAIVTHAGFQVNNVNYNSHYIDPYYPRQPGSLGEFGIDLLFGIGYNRWLNEAIALEVMPMYVHVLDDGSYQKIEENSAIRWGIGLHYYLRPKKDNSSTQSN